MPDRVIKRVNDIGEQEGQSCDSDLQNCWREPYEWTDKVPEDDLEFWGILANDKAMALYPDISAELPGVELEEDEHKYQTETDKPKADFCDLADTVLHNAGINADNMLRKVQARVAAEMEQQGPALVEADEVEIVYKHLLAGGLKEQSMEYFLSYIMLLHYQSNLTV